jgi:hypothetical protein
VELWRGQLPLVPEQDQSLDQASAQRRVHDSIVGVQQINQLASKALCVLCIALADLCIVQIPTFGCSYWQGQIVRWKGTQQRAHLSYEVDKLRKFSGFFAWLKFKYFE